MLELEICQSIPDFKNDNYTYCMVTFNFDHYKNDEINKKVLVNITIFHTLDDNETIKLLEKYDFKDKIVNYVKSEMNRLEINDYVLDWSIRFINVAHPYRLEFKKLDYSINS